MYINSLGYASTDCPLGKDLTMPSGEDLSVVITYVEENGEHLRPGCLERCVASVKRFVSEAEIILVNTKGNLSAGRNKAVRNASREFVAILEDDFELIDDSLQKMVAVLLHDQDVGVVGGSCIRKTLSGDCIRESWSCEQERKNGDLFIWPCTRPAMITGQGLSYHYCDTCMNFLVGRKQALLDVPWDESLPVQEHLPWCLALKDSRWRLAWCHQAIVMHHEVKESERYLSLRERDFDTQRRNSMGVKNIHYRSWDCRVPVGRATLPNIVVITPGHTNSTLFVRQLLALGWKGDVDSDYAEPVAIREINGRLMRGEKVPLQERLRAVQQQPQPFVLKDPRFCYTFEQWAGIFMQQRATLVLLLKDRDRIISSFQRRGYPNAEQQVDKRIELAFQHFNNWVGPKMILHADQIEAAVEMFDVSRSRGTVYG